MSDSDCHRGRTMTSKADYLETIYGEWWERLAKEHEKPREMTAAERLQVENWEALGLEHRRQLLLDHQRRHRIKEVKE